MKYIINTCLLLVMGVFVFAGCAGTSVKPDTALQNIKGVPDWVVKGSGAFGGERGKVFYGIASSFGIKNPSLKRSAADNRARNEVAKVFKFYTASLMKAYNASTMAGDPNVTSEEQHVEEAVKTVTAMTLSGVEIVNHWENPSTHEFFSLARLDLEAFKDSLKKSKDLNSRVRDYIRQNADRLHEKLQKEEDKMQERDK
ncbi:MAG: hypothetical protein ACE5DW_07030 [Thermodesulfobacteriota bacterium]